MKTQEQKPKIRIEKNTFGECAIIEVFGERFTISKTIREKDISFIESIGIHNNKSIGIIWFDKLKNGLSNDTQINSGFEAEGLQETKKELQTIKEAFSILKEEF